MDTFFVAANIFVLSRDDVNLKPIVQSETRTDSQFFRELIIGFIIFFYPCKM